MKTNKVLAKMRQGKRAVGCALVFPSTDLVELIGMAGMDFVYIDFEHGGFSPESIVDMCRVANLYDVTPIGRAPDILPSTIGRLLDWGYQGVEGPHVGTKADAQQLVDACYYAPMGKRSLGASRGAAYGAGGPATEYTQEANAQIYVFALLEDLRAAENIEEIVEVDGIHSYHIGTNDLAQSMGLPGQPNHPKVQEVADRMVDAIHAAGKKTSEELVAAARGTNIFLDGAKAFVAEVAATG